MEGIHTVLVPQAFCRYSNSCIIITCTVIAGPIFFFNTEGPGPCTVLCSHFKGPVDQLF